MSRTIKIGPAELQKSCDHVYHDILKICKYNFLSLLLIIDFFKNYLIQIWTQASFIIVRMVFFCLGLHTKTAAYITQDLHPSSFRCLLCSERMKVVAQSVICVCFYVQKVAADRSRWCDDSRGGRPDKRYCQ